jgi:hypothetical protein
MMHGIPCCDRLVQRAHIVEVNHEHHF